MSEQMAVIALVALCWLATLAFFFWAEHRQWRRYKELTEHHRDERSELLDRIMSRNWAEYKSAENLEAITKAELAAAGPHVYPQLPDPIEEYGQ